MAFNDDEISINDGAPIELYKFDGGTQIWYITSYAETVTSSAEVYVPEPALRRNVLKTGTQENEELSLDIEIPFDHPLVTAYAFETAPPTLELTLYRCHRTDPDDRVLMWTGKVMTFSVESRICKLRVPAQFSYVLNGIAPSPRYQAPCNHKLFDDRCQVDPTSYQHVTTINAIDGNIITVATYPWAEADAVAGEVIYSTGGERRMITSVTGLDIELAYPFATLSVGDSVTLRQGCDHSFTTCKSKFSNGVNFGGCPWVPSRNPFTSKI